MNKTLLLIMCDFMLLNLLALTRWEKAEPAQTQLETAAPRSAANAPAINSAGRRIGRPRSNTYAAQISPTYTRLGQCPATIVRKNTGTAHAKADARRRRNPSMHHNPHGRNAAVVMAVTCTRWPIMNPQNMNTTAPNIAAERISPSRRR